MEKNKSLRQVLRANWLVWMIAAQPLLDDLAYWTRNEEATLAGWIRLAIMLVLPLYLLFTLKRKKGFVISMAVIALFGVLHLLNTLRVGAIDFMYDAAYMARIAQMPVLGICFLYLIREERTKDQAKKGILLAGIITLLSLLLALATGTWNSTYGAGIGISGWIIDDNRTANSILFVTLSLFALEAAAESEKKPLHVLLPVLLTTILIANGTKACYLSLYAIFLGFSAFFALRRIVTGQRLKALLLAVMAVCMVAGVLVYPISPRAKVDNAQAATARKNQSELERKLAELGYDVDSMTLEEKLADPVLFALFSDYYYRMVGYVIPDMFERFGAEAVLVKYNMTTDAERLSKVRLMKITYASLIWDSCDPLTKLVGVETTDVCRGGSYDLENDWPALYFYCGYLGLGLYSLFVLYFIALILRRLAADFKGSLTTENFALLLALGLLLGLAQFSGAALRRPNVSIYLSLVLALIYYQTAVKPIDEEGRLAA